MNRSENVQPASLDLTLDNLIITTEGRQIDISDGQRFGLEGRQTVNVRTREWLEFPFDHVGRLSAITRLAKFGIITSPGHQVAPGFKGQLQFCLFNAGGRRFDLKSGDRIIGLEIMPLSSIPAFGEGVPDGRDPTDRRDVISHFRSNDCNHLIRDFLRTHVTLKPLQSSDKAIGSEIAGLGIDIVESSEEAALSSAVDSALNTLVIIRTNANVRTDLSDKYCAFFDRVAEGLWLSADQVRSAISTLRLADSMAEQSLVKLRDGSRTIVQSPPSSARITLKNLARQIREDPGDLLLMLTGLRNYK